MTLEEVAARTYRTDETRALDGKFSSLLDLDQKVTFYLGKLEYEDVGLALLRRARELGFFVGVTRDYLERSAHMTGSTYKSMMLSYRYIAVAGNINGVEVIIPTEKMLQNKPTVKKQS